MRLPEPTLDGEESLETTIAARRSRRAFQDRAITCKQLGQVLWSAQGITDRRGHRAAPSAGATFPLEVYAVVGRVEGLEPGIYHYMLDSHSLELVRKGDLRARLTEAKLAQSFIAQAPVIIAVAAEYGRTAATYGSRTERYVHMEVGHVGQNIHLQCESLRLGTCAVGAFQDLGVKEVLGIDEEPLYLMPVGYAR